MFSDSNSVDGTSESDLAFTRFDLVVFVAAMTMIVIVAAVVGATLLVIYTAVTSVSGALQWICRTACGPLGRRVR